MAGHARFPDVPAAAVHHFGHRCHAQLPLCVDLLQCVRPAGGDRMLATVRNLPGQCGGPGGFLHEAE